MTLKKWTTGDTITERSANNKGVRKGTTTDLGNIVDADSEVGDVYFDETENALQTLYQVSTRKRSSLRNFIGADETEVTVIGTTPTQVKDVSFIKRTAGGLSGNRIFVVAEIKTSNAGTTAHLRVRLDGGGSDKLDLTTTSTSYVVVSGNFDISAESDNVRHTLEFFMDDGAGDTITMRLLEVYAI